MQQYNQPHKTQDGFAGYKQEYPSLTLVEAVQLSLHRYSDFTGRSRRSEFWYFRLFQLLVNLVLLMLLGIAAATEIKALFFILSGIMIVVNLALIIPSLASSVRRFHDTGNSGWLILLDVFCTGGIVTIVFGVMDSQPFDNQYGPNPKLSKPEDQMNIRQSF